MSTLVVGVVLDGGREQGVNEGGLSKARLASNLTEMLDTQDTINSLAEAQGAHHNSEAGTTLRDNLVSLVGEIGNANR